MYPCVNYQGLMWIDLILISIIYEKDYILSDYFGYIKVIHSKSHYNKLNNVNIYGIIKYKVYIVTYKKGQNIHLINYAYSLPKKCFQKQCRFQLQQISDNQHRYLSKRTAYY